MHKQCKAQNPPITRHRIDTGFGLLAWGRLERACSALILAGATRTGGFPVDFLRLDPRDVDTFTRVQLADAHLM